jgi:hypothetical protein
MRLLDNEVLANMRKQSSLIVQARLSHPQFALEEQNVRNKSLEELFEMAVGETEATDYSVFRARQLLDLCLESLSTQITG